MNDYWVSLLVACYQAGGYTIISPTFRDNDPDPLVDNSTYPNGPYWSGDDYEETLQTGWTVRWGDWDSMVFRATVLDFPMHAHFEDQVIAHELGHSGGNTGSESQHHNEGCLMSESVTEEMTRFCGETLNRFREAGKW
jgi:hypothetical protein